MRLKKITFLILFLAFSSICEAQDIVTSLHFGSTTIDLGTIKEDGGRVTKYIEAVNSSDTPIYIEDIVTSCGCTSAEFTREVVEPHQRVVIGITFDPMNRPGRVDKEVWVKERGKDVAARLLVVGYVEPRQRSIEEIYPFVMGGGVRMRATSRAFGYIMQGCEAEERIEFVNTATHEVSLSVESISNSRMLQVECPSVVMPNGSGVIIIRYALPKSEEIYGTLSDTFYLVIDGERSRYAVTTEAIAIDNFDAMDDISAPRCEFSKNIIKFGEVNSPKGLHTEWLVLKNVGDSMLDIRCVECSDVAISCAVEGENEVKKGESVRMAIMLDCSKIANPDKLFTARIRLITSDPLRPMQTIKVTAVPMW